MPWRFERDCWQALGSEELRQGFRELGLAGAWDARNYDDAGLALGRETGCEELSVVRNEGELLVSLGIDLVEGGEREEVLATNAVELSHCVVL